MRTPSVAVVGAGGHAKVCIESLLLSDHAISACVGLPGDPPKCLGYEVLYGDERLKDLWDDGVRLAFIALGPNGLRSRLADYATGLGYEIVKAIHPSSVISPTASLGRGVAVMAGAVINAATSIGDLSIINTGATVDHDCRLGRAVHVAPQVGVAGNVSIGDRTFLGIGSRVIPDRRIGADVMVGAGAAVIRDLEDKARVAGVPARPIRESGAG